MDHGTIATDAFHGDLHQRFMSPVHRIPRLERDYLGPAVLLDHVADLNRRPERVREVSGEVRIAENLNRAGDEGLTNRHEVLHTRMLGVGRGKDLLRHFRHLLIRSNIDGLDVLDSNHGVAVDVRVEQRDPLGITNGGGVFNNVYDRYRPKQATGRLHSFGHRKRICEIHVTGERVEISATHHYCVGSRLRADEQLRQSFGFLQQLGTLRVIRNVQRV